MNEMISQLPNGDFVVVGPEAVEYLTADYPYKFDAFNARMVARSNALAAIAGINSAPSNKAADAILAEYTRMRAKYIEQAGNAWARTVCKPADPGDALAGYSGRAIATQIKEAAAEEVATADPERVRAALTWNTKTAFNPFPGFTVQSVTSEQPRSERHALQRGGDVS